MPGSVDLYAVINEAFCIAPPCPDDFPPGELGTLQWNAAMAQFEEMRPLIVSMARGLEELLTRVESLQDLVRRAEVVSDEYDDVIRRVIASDEVKLDTYRAAIERLSSPEAFSGGRVVEDTSFSGIELQARMAYARTILKEGPH